MEEIIHLQRKEDHLDSKHFDKYAHLFHVGVLFAQNGQIEDRADLEEFFMGRRGS